jgi:hypothetical protein
MSDLVRRLSIPNEIAVFMWKPFLLPGENQRDYENASPNDDRRHPAKAALKEAKSSADSAISNGGLENKVPLRLETFIRLGATRLG